jgi:hypothetical protein
MQVETLDVRCWFQQRGTYNLDISTPKLHPNKTFIKDAKSFINERHILIILTVAVFTLLFFSPWMSTHAVWVVNSSTLSKSTFIEECIKDPNATMAESTFRECFFAPFGRFVIMERRICFDNATVYSWEDYYYISMEHVYHVGNSTLEVYPTEI